MPGGCFSKLQLAHKQNFLFDLDGTLVDSSPLHEHAFKAALQSYRPEFLDGFDYERMKGRRTRDVFLELGIAEATELTACVVTKQAHYRSMVQQGQLALCPGALRLLALLRAAGRRAFIVTGASHASAQLALAHCGIAHVFEGIVSADDVRYSKPHPQIFQHCLERYQLDRHASLVIEDAMSGVRGARAAGIDAVLVDKAHHADDIPSFHDLHAFAAFLLANMERAQWV